MHWLGRERGGQDSKTDRQDKKWRVDREKLDRLDGEIQFNLLTIYIIKTEERNRKGDRKANFIRLLKK